MNAKDQFEKLGYKLEETEYLFNYKKPVNFYGYKEILISKVDNTHLFRNRYFEGRQPESVGIIEIEEHLAIHQQMIELGWIEK